VTIELISLIELPTFKFTDLEEISDITLKNRLLIERNYTEVKNLKPLNKHQYKLSEISNTDLKKAIDLHISDIPIEDSCAFFGGFALKVNEEFVLFPQCCGLLSEIEDWKKLLSKNFEPFYLSECHPSPFFRKNVNEIIIECDSSHEEFYPKTGKFLRLNHNLLISAIEKVLIELKKISQRLDKFSSFYGTDYITSY